MDIFTNLVAFPPRYFCLIELFVSEVFRQAIRDFVLCRILLLFGIFVMVPTVTLT